VAAAVLADRAVALWAESGEVAAAPKPGEAGAGASVAPAAPSAAEVIAKLLAARSSLGPTQAEFSWVMGPADVTQARYEGRLSVVDATRYRVDFSLAEAVSAENILVVPDGRWAYELSNAENAIGMRVDLVYLKERVRDPAARVLYDPAGGALLELLGQRGYVTYEGDENLDAGRCAVLSYEGGSFRNPQTPGRQTQGEAGVRTRLRYRYEDGLLVSEEELDSRGGARRSYRLLTPHRFEPTPDLLRVPESAHCVDITKQLVRRLLYGPPQPVPGAAAR
jgi:hypothetical protein